MDNAEITPDVFNLIKQNNPEAYAQYQKEMQDWINKCMANLSFTGTEPLDVTLKRIINKLGIWVWDPHDIKKVYYDSLDKLNVWQDSEQLHVLWNNISSMMSTMNSNAQSLSSQLEGRYSAGYIEARINKANSNIQRQLNTALNSYQMLLQWRQQNIALATQNAQIEQAQGQEDSRVFNNKLNALKFAMTADSYRTPEQQQQLLLQTEQIRNDMSLLNQSKLNDLSLYNQYATAKLKNQLEAELTNLDVDDPAQQRANLNRVVWQYFDKYWSIIQRSQSWVVDDVLRYAKEHWVSVAEALRKNFIEPLQSKSEYKTMLNNELGIDPYSWMKYANQWDVTWDKDWNPIVKYSWYWDLPENITKSSLISSLKNWYNSMWGDNFIQSLASLEGKEWLWCWEFVNAGLEWMWDKSIFWDSLVSKIGVCNRDVSEWPVYWAAVVLDTGAKVTDKKWNVINAGHVWFITGITDKWVYITDSNWNWDKKVTTHFMSNEQLANMAKWYYVSPQLSAKKTEHSTPMDSVFSWLYANAKTEAERQTLAYTQTMYEKLSELSNKYDENWYSYLEHFILSPDVQKSIMSLDAYDFSNDDSGAWFLRQIQRWAKNKNLDEISLEVMREFENMVNDNLRLESWAAISSSEWIQNFQRLIPWAWVWLDYSYSQLKDWDDLILRNLRRVWITNEQYIDLFWDDYISERKAGIQTKTNWKTSYDSEDLKWNTWSWRNRTFWDAINDIINAFGF